MEALRLSPFALSSLLPSPGALQPCCTLWMLALSDCLLTGLVLEQLPQCPASLAHTELWGPAGARVGKPDPTGRIPAPLSWSASSNPELQHEGALMSCGLTCPVPRDWNKGCAGSSPSYAPFLPKFAEVS